jgi:hypothetical protein
MKYIFNNFILSANFVKVSTLNKVLLGLIMYALVSCQNNEQLKLTSDERFRVDTTVSSQFVQISTDLEKWCKDSTPILRERFIDSLVIVREQEVLKQIPVQSF